MENKGDRPQAGWYQDSAGALRYWDGNQWTGHTAPAQKAPAQTASAQKAPVQTAHQGSHETAGGPQPTKGGGDKRAFALIGGFAAAVVVVAGLLAALFFMNKDSQTSGEAITQSDQEQSAQAKPEETPVEDEREEPSKAEAKENDEPEAEPTIKPGTLPNPYGDSPQPNLEQVQWIYDQIASGKEGQIEEYFAPGAFHRDLEGEFFGGDPQGPKGPTFRDVIFPAGGVLVDCLPVGAAGVQFDLGDVIIDAAWSRAELGDWECTFDIPVEGIDEMRPFTKLDVRTDPKGNPTVLAAHGYEP